MRNDQRSFDENEWTDEERARFATLSADRSPPAELEQRTVRALRDRGLLGRRSRLSPPIMLGLLLAASVIFVVGALVGFTAASRRSSGAPERAVASTRSVAQIDSADSALAKTRHVVWY
jgi:hypothetical protein